MSPQGGGQPPEWVRTLALFSIITSELVGFVLGGLAVGYGLSHFLGWPKWVMAPLALLGLEMAFLQIRRAVKRLEKKEN